MVEAEKNLEAAIKASQARERDRRQRLWWSVATTSSYSLDALFLGLFVAAGTIPASVFYLFAAGAAAICATTFALYASGWNLRFRDPGVIWPQVAAGIAVHLAAVALAPQIAFPGLANLFTVFAFGVIWLSLRASVVLLALTVLAAGAVLWIDAGRVAMAASKPLETSLTWLCFSLILARCLVLSVHANDMRARLAESRRRLAASLEQVKQLASHDELTGALNRRSLMAALERFCAAIAENDWSSIAPGLAITLSAGVAGFRKSEPNEQLLHRADSALYQAKASGRNNVVLSD